MAERLSSTEIITPRHIVSYFDHEFAKELSPEQGKRDIDEMREHGFTNLVLCVTETDVVREDRQDYLRGLVRYAKQSKMDVWADPWSVGGVFGGEGGSVYRTNGETRCYCNPHVDTLLKDWLETVKEIGIDTAFWDEPEMHCDDHRGDEFTFLKTYTGYAQQIGLENVVCMCANEATVDTIKAVAALETVSEIATDPYFPNAFTRIGEAERLPYVQAWTERTRAIGNAAGKRSHVWVQGFDVPEEQLEMINEHVMLIRSLKMADVALWGFGGCRSVPNFAKPGRAQPNDVWRAAKRAFSLADPLQQQDLEAYNV